MAIVESHQRCFHDRWCEAKEWITRGRLGESTIQCVLKRFNDEEFPETSRFIRNKLLTLLIKAPREFLPRVSIVDIVRSGKLSDSEVLKLYKGLVKQRRNDVCDALMSVLPPPLFRECLFLDPYYFKRWLNTETNASALLSDYLQNDGCWFKLAKWHPQIAAKILTSQIKSASGPSGQICNKILQLISAREGKLAIEVLAVYVDYCGSLEPIDLRFLARYAPVAFYEWLLKRPEYEGINYRTHHSRHHVHFVLGGESQQEWGQDPELLYFVLRQILESRRFVKRLPPHLRRAAAIVHEKHLPLLSPSDKEDLVRQILETSKAEHGFVPSGDLEKLPLAIRAAEARRILKETKIGKGEMEKWWYAVSLPYEEAKAMIEENLRNPSVDIRAEIFTTLGKVTRAAGVEHVDFLLDQAIRSVNDQDTVRYQILEALLLQQFDKMTDTQLNKILTFIQKSDAQIDLSWYTCSSLSKVLWHVWPRLPKEVIKLHCRLATHKEYEGTFPQPRVPLSSISEEAWEALNKYLIHRIREAFSKLGREYISGILEYLGHKFSHKINPAIEYLFSEEVRSTNFKQDDWETMQVIKNILEKTSRFNRSLFYQLRSQLVETDMTWLDKKKIARYCARYRPDIINNFIDAGYKAEGVYRNDKPFCLRLENTADFAEWDTNLQIKYAKFLIHNIICEISEPRSTRSDCFRPWLVQLVALPSIHPKTIIDLLQHRVLKERHQDSCWPRQWLQDLFCEVLGRADDPGLAWRSIIKDDSDASRLALYYLLPHLPRELALQETDWITQRMKKELEEASIESGKSDLFFARFAFLARHLRPSPTLTALLESLSRLESTSLQLKIQCLRHISCDALLTFLEQNVIEISPRYTYHLSRLNFGEIESLHRCDPDATIVEAYRCRYAKKLAQWLMTTRSLNVIQVAVAQPNVWRHLSHDDKILILPHLGRLVADSIFKLRGLKESKSDEVPEETDAQEDGIEEASASQTSEHHSSLATPVEGDRQQSDDAEAPQTASVDKTSEHNEDRRQDSDSISTSKGSSGKLRRKWNEQLNVSEEVFRSIVISLCRYECVKDPPPRGLLSLCHESIVNDPKLLDIILTNVFKMWKYQTALRDSLCESLLAFYLDKPDSLVPLSNVLMALSSNERLAQLALNERGYLDEAVHFLYSAAREYPFNRVPAVKTMIEWAQWHEDDNPRALRMSFLAVRLLIATLSKEIGWTDEMRQLVATYKAPPAPPFVRDLTQSLS